MSTRKYRKYLRLTDSLFRRETGVKKSTFLLMAEVVKLASSKKRGPKPKLSAKDQVLVLLKYFRDYTSFSAVGVSFGISESVAYRTCIFVESTILKDPRFHLPGKKSLLELETEIAIDVSESPVQRASKQKLKRKNRKNKQKQYYSGKKKKHTIKSQVCVEVETKKILSVATEKGRKHDYNLFKKSKTRISKGSHVLVDSGYQGIQNQHANSSLPRKKSKYKKLSKQDKIKNKTLSSKRIVVENVFAVLKKFKIIAERYRNRRKRFALRVNLISAIYNLELA